MFCPNQEELAWAAGFFDGEGHIRCDEDKKGRRYVQLSVAQVHTEVLEKFKRVVGDLGNIYGPYQYKNNPGNWQPRWKYSIGNFEGVQAIVGMLWKYLSPIKRRQAADSLMKARCKAPVGNILPPDYENHTFRQQLAWCAGFYDGEGCTQLKLS